MAKKGKKIKIDSDPDYEPESSELSEDDTDFVPDESELMSDEESMEDYEIVRKIKKKQSLNK